MSLPNYLAQIKSSGIYRFVWDKSEIAGVPAEILRLVVGYSEKGPFNTPVYVQSESEFKSIFGDISKKLEKRGVFFHRMALQALSKGPIIVLNLKKLSTEKVKACSFDVVDDIDPIEIPVESIYDTSRFWKLDPEAVMPATGVKKYISLTAADSKETSCSVIIRGYKPNGYDVTIKNWFASLGEDVPDYFTVVDDEATYDYSSLLVSDFFASIYVFRGEFTAALCASDPLNKYFDVVGGQPQLKEYITNAFGDKIDTLSALVNDDAANFLNVYSGILLPGFKNQQGAYISLDLLFNADNGVHKMMLNLNSDLLYDGVVKVNDLVTTGWLNSKAFNTELKQTELIYTINVAPDEGLNTYVFTNTYSSPEGKEPTAFDPDFITYKLAEGSEISVLKSFGGYGYEYDSTVSGIIDGQEVQILRFKPTQGDAIYLNYNYAGLYNGVTYGGREDGGTTTWEIPQVGGEYTGAQLLATDYLYLSNSEDLSDIIAAGVLAGTDTDGSGKKYTSYRVQEIPTKTYEGPEYVYIADGKLYKKEADAFVLLEGLYFKQYPYTEVNGFDFYNAGFVAGDRFIYNDVFYTLVSFDKDFAKMVDAEGNEVYVSRFETFKKCNHSASITNYNVKPVYFEGYTFANPVPTDIDGKPSSIDYDKLRWQKQILSALVDYEGIRTGLTSRVDIDYRYIVDTFEAFVDAEVHKELALICKQKENAVGFINFPAVKTFKNCTYSSFTDENGRFQTKYIAEGANKRKSPGVLFSLVSEQNGASFVSYNTPVVLSDGTIKTTVPAAALVSNNFMDKYAGRQPYYVVAGPTYGRLIYNGLIGPDYNFTRADLDILEPMGVNASVYVPRIGTFINSNKTAKQTPVTALSALNVRELVIYLQDEIEALLQDYQWEFNTPYLRDLIKDKADTICERVKNNGGIQEYLNVCDESNNTDDVIDNEMFVLSTSIEPGRASGKMVQELTIYKSGALRALIR